MGIRFELLEWGYLLWEPHGRDGSGRERVRKAAVSEKASLCFNQHLKESELMTKNKQTKLPNKQTTKQQTIKKTGKLQLSWNGRQTQLNFRHHVRRGASG